MAFVSKNNFPVLSPTLNAIIDKSHRLSDGFSYDDIESYKYVIMSKLCCNGDLLRTLNNKDLEPKVPTLYDETVIHNGDKHNGNCYRDVNIFNFLKIPGIQDTVKSFVCFEVNDVDIPKFTDGLMKKHIIFRTICHELDIQTDHGIPRHDLLSMIIKSEFDWTNEFGMHIEKIHDSGKVVENGYYYRELVYQTVVPNNLNNKLLNGGVKYRR